MLQTAKTVLINMMIWYAMMFLSSVHTIKRLGNIQNTNNELIKTKSEHNYSTKTAKDLQQSAMKKQIKVIKENKDPLENEDSFSISEFSHIVKLFHKLPSNINIRLQLYKHMLDRVNKIKPKTSFLSGQIDLIKSSLFYRLSMSKQADELLENLVIFSPHMSIREESSRVYVSYKYVNNSFDKIKLFSEKYACYLSSELNAYLDLIVRMPNELLQEELFYIVNNIVGSPIGEFQHPFISSKILHNVKDFLTIQDLDKLINHFLYESKIPFALVLMKVRLSKGDVNKETLHSWHNQVRFYEPRFLSFLQSFENEFSIYHDYLNEFRKNKHAKKRGLIFYEKLDKYIGGVNKPYNLVSSENILKEYLKGEIESEYLEKNTEKAFRNFLAVKDYRRIVYYARKIRSIMNDLFYSTYINFWEGYSLFKLGRIDEAIEMFGSVVVKDPESYYGIISQNFLKRMFKSYSLSRYFSLMKFRGYKSHKDLLNYAHILYYLGNDFEKMKAQSIFISQGIPYSNYHIKISSQKEQLMHAYIKLGLDQEARFLSFNEGITSVYSQDYILSEYLKYNRQDRLNSILSQKIVYIENKKNFSLGKKALSIYYPTPYDDCIEYVIKNAPMSIDPCLIYSIIRIESTYRDNANSPVGAKGLMQIMPATGKWLMDRYLPDIKNYSLSSPNINIFLGSVYIYETISQMGFLNAIAAYNCGPGMVRKICNKYNASDLELVEIHPIKETREYVQKVIRSYEKYLFIYSQRSLNLFGSSF